MSPWILLVLITLGIIGMIALGGYAGHLLSIKLKNARPQSWLGRVFCGFQLWSVVGALLMCATILFGPANPLLIVPGIAFMTGALMIAMTLEPDRKVCKSCGR